MVWVAAWCAVGIALMIFVAWYSPMHMTRSDLPIIAAVGALLGPLALLIVGLVILARMPDNGPRPWAERRKEPGRLSRWLDKPLFRKDW